MLIDGGPVLDEEECGISNERRMTDLERSTLEASLGGIKMRVIALNFGGYDV
jgi:hypothetical protein